MVLPVLAIAFVLRRWLKVELCVVGAHRFGHLALEPEVFLNLQDSTGVVFARDPLHFGVLLGRGFSQIGSLQNCGDVRLGLLRAGS